MIHWSNEEGGKCYYVSDEVVLKEKEIRVPPIGVKPTISTSETLPLN